MGVGTIWEHALQVWARSMHCGSDLFAVDRQYELLRVTSFGLTSHSVSPGHALGSTATTSPGTRGSTGTHRKGTLGHVIGTLYFAVRLFADGKHSRP